ncbi:MAG: hypothetical protein ACTHNP_07530 [Solirubrobacterales bacterium]
MKVLKLLTFVVGVGIALVALLGANSASATVLCTQTETPCSAANKYTTTQDNEIEASLEAGTTTVVRNTEGSIHDTCTSSSLKGHITNAGGSTSTVVWSITELTFRECTNTTTANNAAACELEAHRITGTDNATATVKGCTWTITEFGVTCHYGAGNGIDLGIVTGGTMGTIDVNAVINAIDNSSLLCPVTSVLEAKYTVTKPAGGLYVEPE